MQKEQESKYQLFPISASFVKLKFFSPQLEAKKQYEAVREKSLDQDVQYQERLRRLEAEQNERELEREKLLIAHKLQKKGEMEVNLADFRHEQAIREHEATKKVWT